MEDRSFASLSPMHKRLYNAARRSGKSHNEAIIAAEHHLLRESTERRTKNNHKNY